MSFENFTEPHRNRVVLIVFNTISENVCNVMLKNLLLYHIFSRTVLLSFQSVKNHVEV